MDFTFKTSKIECHSNARDANDMLFFFSISSVSVSLSTLDRLESKSVMLVGNSTVWNMESNLTVRCPLTKLSELVMIPSIPSSVRLELENMCHVPSSSTWNPPSLVNYNY